MSSISRKSRIEPDLDDELRKFKAEVFRCLAHPTRVHIFEILGKGERSVGQILDELGVEAANLSQHLSVLRAKKLVMTRKEGNQVFYALRDPMFLEVLKIMKKYFLSHLNEAVEILQSAAGSK